MTSYVVSVLHVLSEATEPVGWYQIERRLSNMTIDERLHLPTVLDDLVEKGLVSTITFATVPRVRYEITQAGLEKVQKKRDGVR